VYCNLALGEATQTTLLRIDIQDYVPYNFDVFDIQKFATGPTLTPWADPGRPTFESFVFIGDIVAVNGKPVKGLWTARGTTMALGLGLVPGRTIADVTTDLDVAGPCSMDIE